VSEASGDSAGPASPTADGFERFITENNAFRILVATSTGCVREATTIAGTGPVAGDLFGRLLTGAALLELAQSPAHRVQITLDHNGSAGVCTADVWPGVTVRGRIEHPDATETPVLGTGQLQVSRVRVGSAELYQSVVEITEASVADSLQRFMLESEQAVTFFSLVTAWQGDDLLRAGGMVVQALPEMRHEHLGELTGALEKARFEDLVQAGDSPIDAARALLRPLGLVHLGCDPLAYQCRCSQAVAVRAVLTLDPTELASVKDGGEERVTCDFCGTVYVVTSADLPS